MPEPSSFLPLELDNAALCQAVFEHAAVAMVIVNPDGIIVLANDKCEEVFGYDRSELLGASVEMLLALGKTENHRGHVTRYFQYFESKMGHKRALQARRKNGTLFPVEIRLGGLEVSGKRFALSVIEDISGKNQIEQQLQESQYQLASIINNAVDGIITITERGMILSANPSAAGLFGYLESEMIGKNIHFLMPEPYHSEHDGYLQNYRQTAQKKIIGIGREVTGKRKNGELFPFYLSVSEVQLKDKRIFTGIVHDLTEQKRAEEELRQYSGELEKRVDARTSALAQAIEQMEKEIQERKGIEQELLQSRKEIEQALSSEKELNELKSRFISMASHEFRTPLATILSSVSLIDRYHDPKQQEKRVKHIKRIKSNVKNLTQILNDFLSLSKLEEGQISLRPEWLQLKDFAQELTEELQGQAKQGQTINYTHKGEESAISLDPQLLKNICYNFLSNAIKYSPEGADIGFHTQQNEKEIRIDVQDQGIGIPQEEQEHLFERFFRANNVTHIQGTGLGLSIVKRYVDLMQGDIGFESSDTHGTHIWIRIPIHN